MPDSSATIEAHLKEARTFEPPEAFRQQANVSDEGVYERARKDPEGYWAWWAEQLEWSKKWERVLDWTDPPFAKWFVGGKINASVNCLDRHIREGRGDKVAFHWEGEPGDTRTLTYSELKREVCRFAAGLKGLGVKKGDRVTMYLPMVLELPIAMLACARIGAAHNVVFGGFSPKSVGERMNDCESRVLVTCDGYYRGGKTIEQKGRADEAAAAVDAFDKMVVVKRLDGEAKLQEGRDVWWHDLVEGKPDDIEAEAMDAEDMLFLMYTSGTTGKPKGIVHTTGGYLTGTFATTRWVFDTKEEDVYWCMADIGWITGHSYIVYGPLTNGLTQVMYEGAPMYPDKDRAWAIAERYKVNVLYTAPTAIRGFMKFGGEHPEKHDLSSLRLLGTVGEPINPEAWMWYHEKIGGTNCPIVDTWWQTETGMHMITPLPGVTTTVPGSATKPFPGIDAAILDENGDEVGAGKGGFLAIRKPWPSMLRTLWGEDERFIETYWSKWDKKTYFAGDGARKDKKGNFWILGRIDDVLNVSGHRLSTMEIESALVGHGSVAEAAVVGASDPDKGQAPVAFVILESGSKDGADLRKTLNQHITEEIGPIAKPREIVVVPDLPKTRSGKIMRRLLVDICEGRDLGDTTTLADPDVPKEIKDLYEERAAKTA
ncbi:MAG: acetate--CoA ligase [Euryarchaeota archaeon]|nr:acetate--CoA ligase [Euryarchaeota archaeon]